MYCSKCGKNKGFYKMLTLIDGQFVEQYECKTCEYINSLDDLKYGKPAVNKTPESRPTDKVVDTQSKKSGISTTIGSTTKH